MSKDGIKFPESFETLRDLFLDTKNVEKIIENAFKGPLDIDELCNYITSNLFKRMVSRVYSVYNFAVMRIPRSRLVNMDKGFLDLLSRLLRLHFLAYSGDGKETLMPEFKKIDDQLISFLKANTRLEIRDNESSFGIIFNKLIVDLLKDNSDIRFLKGTKIKDYNSKISELMKNLFSIENFLKKYNDVYLPLLHANMVVFNFSKFFKSAQLLEKGFTHFTIKRFENLCTAYTYLSEYYAKHARLLYAVIFIVKADKPPDIQKLKRYSFGTISSKIRRIEDFKILGLETTQIRNSIAHQGNHYDSTKRKCIFDDREHEKEPIIIDPEDFENQTKELFALSTSISKVANFSTIFYFLTVRSLFDTFDS